MRSVSPGTADRRRVPPISAFRAQNHVTSAVRTRVVQPIGESLMSDLLRTAAGVMALAVLLLAPPNRMSLLRWCRQPPLAIVRSAGRHAGNAAAFAPAAHCRQFQRPAA